MPSTDQGTDMGTKKKKNGLIIDMALGKQKGVQCGFVGCLHGGRETGKVNLGSAKIS